MNDEKTINNLEIAIENGFINDGSDCGLDQARTVLEHRHVTFYIKDVAPGKIVKFGCQQGRVPGLFNVPLWAVDSNGQCWSHEGHLYMTPISVVELLSGVRLDTGNESWVREALKLKQLPPQWLVTATKEGFTNPTYDLNQFDWTDIQR